MRTLLAIALFGGLGSVARHLLSTWVKGRLDLGLPLGTLLVNVLGCFLLGLLTALAVRGVVSEAWRGPLAIGFLGGLTTFSTFGLETVVLAERAQVGAALGNVGLQLILGLGAAALGLLLGRVAGG